MWRPNSWKTINPECNKDCQFRVEDRYGLFCDIPCQKHSEQMMYERGADVFLNGLVDELSSMWDESSRLEFMNNLMTLVMRRLS